MTKDKLKQLQKQYRDKFGSSTIHWQCRIIAMWEHELLKHIKAITGDFILQQPLLKIYSKKSGDTKRLVDYSGDISRIEVMANSINAEKRDEIAKLEYFPHIYSEYIELDKEIREDEYTLEQIEKQQRLMQDKQAKLM